LTSELPKKNKLINQPKNTPLRHPIDFAKICGKMTLIDPDQFLKDNKLIHQKSNSNQPKG